MAGSPVCYVQSENNLVDRISQLPTEILVDILSLLTLKEVGRSSVLSKRWQDLWKSTARLNFDVSKAEQMRIARIANEELRRLEKSKFLAWVNQVVRLHECPSIEEFRVKFDLDSSYAHDIDEWIKFMIRKRPKRIELDLYGYRVDKFYSIPKECCDFIKSESNLTNLMNLTSIRLDYVNVDGELVEYLLSKCPCLEMLSVRNSNTLVNLKVVDPSLLLKNLEIHSCGWIERIELCAPKLEKFIYYGPKVKFYIRSNPNLIEFCMGGFRQDVTYALVPFGSFLSQLETLTLTIYVEDGKNCNVDLPNFGELSNLKHLTLEFKMEVDRVLTVYTKLIVASPVLAKFTLVMAPGYRPVDKQFRRNLAIQPHRCLKEVEIIGFQGGIADSEMARYLVTNAINLEKMVINPMHPHDVTDLSRLEEVRKRLARIENYVKELKEGLPPGAELTVVVDMEEQL